MPEKFIRDTIRDDLGQRVAVLEANQETYAETLRDVVKDLKGIVITLAQRKAVEKIAFTGVGGLFTLIGWFIEHTFHR